MENKQISDSWGQGDAYERYIGRWSRKVAPLFLSWLDLPGGQRWLDVGCGTGALCAAILDHCSPRSVTGAEPSDGFLKAARGNLAGQAALFRGTATEIALEHSAVDVVVSGLVLNFVSDPLAALHEMARVIRNGGTIGAYVWDYAGKMELIRIFWETAGLVGSDAARMNEGKRFPICSPDALNNLFTSAGLVGIQVTAIDIATRFTNFEDYWQPFLGGQGPAPAYLMSLDDDERTRLRERLRKRIPAEADGSISLIARAWAVRAAALKAEAKAVAKA